MKLAIYYHLPIGGALRVVKNQITYLKKHHFVKVFNSSLPLTGNRLKRDLQNFISLSRYHRLLAQTIDQQGFNLCLVHPDWLTQAPYLLKYLKTPSIYYCEELLRIAYEPELGIPESLTGYKRVYEILTRKLRQYIDKTNAQKATRIYTSSKYIQNLIYTHYHRSSQICPPGVDTNVFKPIKIKPCQVLFIGEKAPINGWSLASKLPLKLKVIDKQNLTDQQLAKEYSKSFCTLCLGHREPFGLVSLESQACQTPVIALNQGGYKETVLDQKTGFLIPQNFKTLLTKVNLLIQNPQIRAKMGKQGRQQMKLKFSWANHFKILNL
ncbi:MAG: glycosyltransferase [Candidatus Beckwithbacteria bacterium]